MEISGNYTLNIAKGCLGFAIYDVQLPDMAKLYLGFAIYDVYTRSDKLHEAKR